MLKERSSDRIRDFGFERLLTMKDIKNILGVSYGVIYGLIESGDLKAYKVTGDRITRREVGVDTAGIRFKPADVRAFLKDTEIL